MSSCSRRTALLSLAALAACGYAPVYGPGGSAETMRGSIEVADPSDRNSFLFVAELEQRLGRPASPRYNLTYSLSFTTESGGISTTAAVTRYTLVGTATYSLTETGTGRVVSSGAVEGFTGYSGTLGGEAFAATQTDATERLIVILADKLVTRLSLLDL